MCQLGNLKRYLIKPEYIFRPSQGVRRILRRLKPRPRSAVVELPWKLQLCIRLDDHIGWSIWRTGVYDLCVTEVLWRLIDKGETSVDVGANIGHMTSVMVKRVGASGKVHAYEAHPEVHGELAENVARWSDDIPPEAIDIPCLGISNHNGEGFIAEPPEFDGNRGTSLLAYEPGEHAHKIRVSRLDQVLSGCERIGVVKIDVEEHELEVLEGATALIDDGRIRDIVFEELGDYPTPVTDFLEQRGYEIFSLDKGLGSVLVGSAGNKKKR